MDLTPRQSLIKTQFMFHLENRNETSREFYGTESWWKEHGAFVSIMPRGSGKSTLIANLYNSFSKIKEQVKIATISNNLGTQYRKAGIPKNDLIVAISLYDFRGIIPDNIHLFVDEYMYVTEDMMKFIYSQNWKSLNLFSTLR